MTYTQSKTTYDPDGTEHRHIQTDDAVTAVQDALTDIQHVARAQGLNPADAALVALRIAAQVTDAAAWMIEQEQGDSVRITTSGGPIARESDLHRHDTGGAVLAAITALAAVPDEDEDPALPMPGERPAPKPAPIDAGAREILETVAGGNTEPDALADLAAEYLTKQDARQ